MIARLRDSQLVGRGVELLRLDAALAGAQRGVGQLVVLSGEAGVGKSRLIDAFLRSEESANVLYALGRCYATDEIPRPFCPFVDLFRSLRRSLEVNASTHDVSEDLNESRPQFFDRCLRLIETACERGPLILVIEDVHWSDVSTRDLLAYLVTNVAEFPVMFVVTFRSDEAGVDDTIRPFMSQITRDVSATSMELCRLGRDELIAHLDECAGSQLTDVVAESLWQRSQGNPFVAEELLVAHLNDVHANGSVDKSTQGIPSSIRDAFSRRVKHLSGPTQRILRIAAIGGMQINYNALHRAAGITQDEADCALREGVQAQIIDGDGERFEFRHALLVEYLATLLMPGERLNSHLAYAQALQDRLREMPKPERTVRAALLADICDHLLKAEQLDEAFEAALSAATAAEASFGYSEAYAHIEKALSVLPQLKRHDLQEHHVLLLERAARLALLASHPDRAVELAQEAVVMCENEHRSCLLLRVQFGTYLTAAGDSSRGLSVLESIVHDVQSDEASSLKAQVFIAYANALAGLTRHRESLTYAHDALTMSTDLRDIENECRARNTVGANLVVLGRPDEGAEMLRQSLRIAESLNDPREIAMGYRQLALVLSGPLNQLEEALDVAAEGLAHVHALGLERNWEAVLRAIAADTLFRLGRWGQSREFVDAGLQQAREGTARVDLHLARAKIDIGEGNFASARHELELINVLSRRTVELRFSLPLVTLRIGLALWLRDIDGAVAQARRGFQLLDQSPSDDVWFAAPFVWHALHALAEKAIRVRAVLSLREADAIVGEGARYRVRARRMCESGHQQGALRQLVDAYDAMCEGELARVKAVDGQSSWQRAVSRWHEIGQSYPEAYCRLRLSEALLASSGMGAQRSTTPRGALDSANVVVAAENEVRRAHEIARSLGAKPLVTEIEEFVRLHHFRLGEASTPDGGGVVDLREAAIDEIAKNAGLTKREVQVLRLVADGKSNREIAETCFISEKTVSVHVSNVMAKLGVHSRVQAAAMIHRATGVVSG